MMASVALMEQDVVKTGKRNLITDIASFTVGHAVDNAARTGVTVIVPEKRAVAACDVRGGGPGTRETDALRAENLVDEIDAVVLAGGSVYGLDAAAGVTACLGAQGRGFQTGAAMPSPIVPAAIIFDLANGGDIGWGETPPYHDLGRAAFGARATEFPLGNQGAGFGAVAGNIKGGLGSASALLDGLEVGALMVANPVGSVMDANARLWAQDMALMHEGVLEYGTATLMARAPQMLSHPLQNSKLAGAFTGANTSIGVVASSADLTKAEAMRVALMAQDGLARAIRPIHTPFDGDTIFVLASGARPLAASPEMRPLRLALLGALAADCVSRAIGRAIWAAADLGEINAYQRYVASSG